MQRTAGLLLLVGSVLFVIAAFAPISMQVFGRPVESQIAAIQSSSRGWLVVNILFGAGAALVAAGLAFFALHLSATLQNRNFVALAAAGAIVAAIGVLLWIAVLVGRLTTPPEQWAGGVSGTNGWMFPAYSVLTLLALMATGYVLVQAGYPAWLGWGMLAIAALALVGFVVLGDMPPFVYYLPTLVMGIVLLRHASQASSIQIPSI